MDLKSLENVLVKNAFRKYTNVSFLEKLRGVFSELKANGNTQLISHKGVGTCSCNKDKKVFNFVGNKTQAYFTLSYQEDENNYYNFSTSCSEVQYENTLQLKKFHFFSLKPQNTSEYKQLKDISNPIREYKAFGSKSICSMEDVQLWLEKYKNYYSSSVEALEDKIQRSQLNSVELLVKKEFEILYGKMAILSKLYRREAYFEQQLLDYNAIKDSISKLKIWFDYQNENKHKYKLFSSVFYDNRELTHFCLNLDELTLNPEDFKHTLQYLSIIENSKAIEFEGTIKTISVLEVFEKTKSRRAFKKRQIVISIDDFCCSEYQISFTDGRAKHLENIDVGQYVKISARLTGGEWENSEGIKEYQYGLYGWRVEKLTANPKMNSNKEEMDLYTKYILPPPF